MKIRSAHDDGTRDKVSPVPKMVLQYKHVRSAPHLFQCSCAHVGKFRFGGRVAGYLGLAPNFLMHALVTGSLHGMEVVIEAIQPFPVKQLNNRPICGRAGLVQASAVTAT
jgi:hypothetical protein